MGQEPSKPLLPEPNSTTDMTNLTYLAPPDIPEPEDEQVPPYEPAHNPSGDQNVWTGEKAQGTTCPRNPNAFVYGGPILANVRPKNVILFGETGVGKSSIVNLMADAEVAMTSSNLDGCTLDSTEHTFLLSGEIPFRIYDTVGLNEPDMGVNTLLGAIEKAHKLVRKLHAAGGVDLLLFCIRGGRITATLQRNYRLFFEFLGEKQIPLAIVVTNLELEYHMEGWWERNAETLQKYEISPVAHSCITAAPARLAMFAEKRRESRCALQRMLHDAFSASTRPYMKEEKSWFITLLDFLKSIFLPSSWFKQKDLAEQFENRCSFSRDEAQQLAGMFLRGG